MAAGFTASSNANGVFAERLAAQYLERLGIHILAVNYRCHRGEIDLIGRDDETLCFIEVRYRSQAGYGTAADTISATKRQRIARTAEHFLAFGWRGAPCACRFDVVTIEGRERPKITLIRDAFYLTGDTLRSPRRR